MTSHELMICLAAVTLNLSCTRANPAYVPNPELPDECRSGVEVTEAFRSFPRPEMLDILFVVDASGDDPEALQTLFADAVGPLGAITDELGLDVRAAVATTDATVRGLSGPNKTAPGCEANDAVIADSSDDGWETTLRCNLIAPPSASLYDQPLLVVHQLLEDPPDGMLRPDARLLVIVASRSDDCSAAGPLSGAPREACASAELRGVDELVDGWAEQWPLSDLGLVVFAGPPSGLGADDLRAVCSSTIGSATPGNRLFDATGLVEHSTFHSVCTDEVFLPLSDAVATFVSETPIVICPGEMSHEPLAVRVDGGAIPLGDEGFIYVASSADCPGGAIRFAAAAVTAVDEIEITYCTPE